MDLISVVVPVYNIEKYIRECVDSIRSQTYSLLEIWLIDDGSSDNSGAICDEYLKLDDRINVVHKVNGGLSDARNCGIRNATGRWIAFIDGDDWIHPQMLEFLYSAAIEMNADIACCRLEKFYDGSFIENKQSFAKSYKCYDKNEAIVRIPEIGQEACNKLYKKRIFDNVTFPFGRFHEDEFTIHRIIWNSGKIVQTNLPLYFYRQRRESIMSTPSFKSQTDAFEAYDDRISFIEENKWEEAIQKTVNDYLAYILNRYLFYLKVGNKDSKEICDIAVFKAKTLMKKYGKLADFIYRLFAHNRIEFMLFLKVQGQFIKVKRLFGLITQEKV